MQWCVYLVAIPAIFFLGQVALELIGQPIHTILRLRQHALERMLAFRNMQLPGPRELAVSSRQIRAYDQASQNLRHAQRSFADLGAQLLAFSESEPTVRALMTLCGLDIVRAGHELINLADVYATARTDRDEFRHAIEEAHQATMMALAASRPLSGDRLIKIRLEPMDLSDKAPSRQRRSQLYQRRATARRAPSLARPPSGPARRFANEVGHKLQS
jgi:hypothetical protein